MMFMRDLLVSGILFRVLAVMVVVVFLGISPLPHVVEGSYEEAGRSLSYNNHRAAAELLAFIANHLPQSVGLWEQAGNLSLMAPDPNLAITCYKTAAESGDLTPQGYLKFGDAYEQTGNLFTAIQLWQVASSMMSENAVPIEKIASAYRDMGEISSLIDTIKILNAPPFSEMSMTFNNLDQIYELGLLLAADDPVSAPPYLLQAFNIDPNLMSARDLAFDIQRTLSYNNPTYSLMASGRKLGSLNYWELATYAFRKVTTSQPDYSEGWAYLGEAVQHVTNPCVNAETALRKALEIDPNSLSGNVFFAIYWMRNDNPSLAYQHFTIASELDPTNPTILMDLGSATAMLGDLEEADNHYQDAVNLSYNNPSELRKYVDFLIRYNKDLREVALPIARLALSADVHNPGTLDLMGRVLFRLGDLISAERFFLQALDQDPAFVPAYQHLGLLYNLQGKSVLAADTLMKAQSLAYEGNGAEQNIKFHDVQLSP